ncbi:MAG: hypothetical protein HY308_00830 [Gammaproteobacteria bacterium]|nr:hypothetical protein [Gammaproteobacteria bacterium]
MDSVTVSLADAERRYKQAAESILDAYKARGPAQADPVTPCQLNAAIEQFLASGIQLERANGDNPWMGGDKISELGDYGISLLMDLSVWAQQLGLDEADSEFEEIALSFADWVMRHGGEIRTLEPIVDALARFANRARDTESLVTLTDLMTRVVHATAPAARLDLTRSYANPAWRLLNLNRAIVATRTHDLVLMEQVFDELVDYLPDAASRFFAEGMQQMDRFDYPVPVREVMGRYFDRWTRRTMH